MTWDEALKLAIPVVLILATVVWALLVYHGDGRWVRRDEALDKGGDPRWAPKSVEMMALGQNDKLADHEGRMIRLEERDVTILIPLRDALEGIAEKLGAMNDRLVRLEDIPRRLEAIEVRITANRVTGN